MAVPGIIAPSDPAIGAVWAEAHPLGALAQGALPPIARPAADRPVDPLFVAAQYLAGLDAGNSDPTDGAGRGFAAAAVAGRPDGCHREGSGAAVIWRFSPASIRRAFDHGTSATELSARCGR